MNDHAMTIQMLNVLLTKEVLSERWQKAVNDAVELLREQKALLQKAEETLAEMDFEFFCDDLMSDDGWCEENCEMSSTKPKCIDRWLRKKVEEDKKLEQK